MEELIRARKLDLYRRIQNLENTKQIVLGDYFDALNTNESVEMINAYKNAIRQYSEYIRLLHRENWFLEMRLDYPATDSS
jgi:hypothetical protein